MTFDGLGEHLFKDVRFRAGWIEDRPSARRSAFAHRRTILVAGRNFGCGSSREHAPQSIAKFGFKAMIAESFAEIFFGNSIALGAPLCVSSAVPTLDSWRRRSTCDPTLEVTIDLIEGVVRAGDVELPFEHQARCPRGAGERPLGSDRAAARGKRAGALIVAELPYLHFRNVTPKL